MLVDGRDALRESMVGQLAIFRGDGCGLHRHLLMLRTPVSLHWMKIVRPAFPARRKETGHSKDHRSPRPVIFNFYSDLRYSTRSVFSRPFSPSLKLTS